MSLVKIQSSPVNILCSVRLSVRSLDFQSKETGSTPVPSTNLCCMPSPGSLWSLSSIKVTFLTELTTLERLSIIIRNPYSKLWWFIIRSMINLSRQRNNIQRQTIIPVVTASFLLLRRDEMAQGYVTQNLGKLRLTEGCRIETCRWVQTLLLYLRRLGGNRFAVNED